jgi:riboflavin kinase / FMN adenylyltransferase
VKGRQKGREFGFPTANVSLSYPYVVPAEGVYATFVLVDDMVWPAATNVGVPRTFVGEPNCASIEANLIGFDGDLYGREVAVGFVEKLRGQQKFESIESLMATVNSNIDWVREHIGATGFRL